MTVGWRSAELGGHAPDGGLPAGALVAAAAPRADGLEESIGSNPGDGAALALVSQSGLLETLAAAVPTTDIFAAEADAALLGNNLGPVAEEPAPGGETAGLDDPLTRIGDAMTAPLTSAGGPLPEVTPGPTVIPPSAESQNASPEAGCSVTPSVPGPSSLRLATVAGQLEPRAGQAEERVLSRTIAEPGISGGSPESFSGELRAKHAAASSAGQPSANALVGAESALPSTNEVGLPGQPLRGSMADRAAHPSMGVTEAGPGSEAAPAPRAERGPELDPDADRGAPSGEASPLITTGGTLEGRLASGSPAIGAPAAVDRTPAAPSRVTESTPSTVAATQMAAPVAEPRPDPGSRFPALAVRVESEAVPGHSSPAPVDVVFEQRGRELSVSVRSADPGLSRELRQSLPELGQRLDQEGFETRFSAAPERISAADGSDLRDLGAESSSAERRGGGNGSPGAQDREPGRGQSGGRGAGDSSQDDLPRRPLEWLEELTRQTGRPDAVNPRPRNPQPRATNPSPRTTQITK